ncbi:MAG: bacteriocin [Pseudomonadota bacterium]
MKRMVLAAVAAASLGLAGCNSTNEGDRALVGGALGATTGAVIASAAGASTAGTIIAATTGAAAGAIVGSATTPRCVDQFGDPVPCPR